MEQCRVPGYTGLGSLICSNIVLRCTSNQRALRRPGRGGDSWRKKGPAVNRDRRSPLHGRGLGATIGAAVGLCAALVVHQIVPHGHGIFALPATVVTALFVGTMAGLMFASIIVGGREDDRATQAAREALIEQRAHFHDQRLHADHSR